MNRYNNLHPPAKFRPNRTIRDIVMTSYPFSKTAATAPQFYFRFRFSRFRSFRKVDIYLQTKFRRDNPIHSWVITTSGFWKQTAAMLEFYFRFRFSCLRHRRPVILHLPTKFRPYRTIRDIVMTSYPFSRWRPSTILNFLKVTADHPRSANEGLSLIFKFRLHRIYSFGDIAIFMLCRACAESRVNLLPE